MSARMTSGQGLQRIYRYQIDETDCITFVCPNWLRFATENATPELNEAAVIGQPLWQYIADRDCREFYRRLFSRIRQIGITTFFPFRCDSPTVRRFMKMQISQLPHAHLQFHVQLVREEPQPYSPLLDPEIKRSDQWITMCAWCKRIKTSQDQWIEISEALRTPAVFVEPDIPNLTHGICPPCQQMFLYE